MSAIARRELVSNCSIGGCGRYTWARLMQSIDSAIQELRQQIQVNKVMGNPYDSLLDKLESMLLWQYQIKWKEKGR